MASNAENVSIWWRHHVNHKLILKMKKKTHKSFGLLIRCDQNSPVVYPHKGSIMRNMCPWREIIMEVRLNRPENNTSLMVKSPTSSYVKHCSARQIYILPSFRCAVWIMCDIVISYFSLLSTYIYIHIYIYILATKYTYGIGRKIFRNIFCLVLLTSLLAKSLNLGWK